MPRFSTPVTQGSMNLIQGVCDQYGVTQRELADVMFSPKLFILTVAQEERLKELGKERRTPPEVKKAMEALLALSDEQIAAILETRSREEKQDGSGDQD